MREQARAIAAYSSTPQSVAGRFVDRSVEAIHPYFGVVTDPDRYPAGVVSDLGFPESPLTIARASGGVRAVETVVGSRKIGRFRRQLRVYRQDTSSSPERLKF